MSDPFSGRKNGAVLVRTRTYAYLLVMGIDDAKTFSDSVDGDVKANQGRIASGSFTAQRALSNETKQKGLDTN